MAKRGVTPFSATQVAKQGLAVSTALLKMVDLEREVSRLRHHVSVLSRRNHGPEKELAGLQRVGEGVASQKETEPQVVAEPPEPEVVVEVAPSVASDEEDESVASGEPRMEVKEGVRGEVVFDDRMLDLRDRMSDEDVVVGGKIVPLSGYAPAVEGEVRREVPFLPLGPAAMVPVGPSQMRGRGEIPDQWPLVGVERRGGLRRLSEEIWNKGGERRVAGVRNGMGGDSFQTRGSYARPRTSGHVGVRHEGFVPYRRWG